MITPKDAITILEKNGFQIDFEIVRDDVGKITYNGERVGTVYEDEVYIASEFPHLRDNTYEDTEKQCSVRFASHTARTDLEDCIQVLFNSLAAFEEEMRAKRVHNVQQYFQKKKEQLMNSMVKRLSDALNEVRNRVHGAEG